MKLTLVDDASFVRVVTTDADGYFQFEQLKDGSYTLVADNGYTLVTTNLIEVAGQADVNGYEATAVPPGVVSGYVLGEDGTVVQYGEVTLFKSANDMEGETVTTDGYGAYRFTDLEDGAYAVFARPYGAFKGLLATNALVSVAARELRVDFELPLSARAYGAVTRWKGGMVEDGEVRFYQEDGNYLKAEVSTNGTWEAAGLAPGKYSVGYVSADGLEDSASATVTIAAGDETEIALEAHPAVPFQASTSFGVIDAKHPTLTVYFAATAPVTANNDIEGLSVGQIVFSEGSAGATIAGNAIEVTGSVVNNSGAAQTISAPVTFTGDITTTMADAASTVTYAGGVTGVKIAASSADERVLRGHYTLTGEDVWPADGNGYSQQTTPANGEKWTLKSGSTLRVKKANLKNFTIESGATAIAETACHRQQSYYERVDPSNNYKYYNLLTEANHGTYKIGTLETLGNLEVYPAYSAENYSGGVTIVDKLDFASQAKFGSMDSQAFYLSPGHRTASGWDGDGVGVWAIGEGGLALKATTENSSGAAAQSRTYDIWYRARGDVTLNSIADWTLAENPANIPPHAEAGTDDTKVKENSTWKSSSWIENQTVASLTIGGGSTLTIDTSHYATDGETGVAGHTVTFEGQVAGGADTKVAVTGDGTLVWDARAGKFTGAISVANGATLKLAGCAYGFKWLDGFTLDGTLVIDPIRKPVSVDATPVFGANAKIKLDADFDGTTLGKFVLVTRITK